MGDTIISYADRGDLDGIRQCLERGVDVDTVGNYGWTPLLSAVNSEEKQAVFLLLDRSANVNRKTSDGDTVLHLSVVSKKSPEIFHALLKAGSPVNEANQKGITPLMKAVGRGHDEYAQALLARGAKVSTTDNEGRSALDFADAKMARLLFDLAGAGLPFGQRKKAFLRAVETEYLDLAEVLIEKCSADMDEIKKQLSAERKNLAPCIDTIDQRIEERKQKAARDAEEEKKRAEEAADPWKIALPDAVSRITVTDSHKITDHFNFMSRERLTIVQNRDTKAELPVLRESFDEMKNRAYLEEALTAFTERGGKADPGVLLSGYVSRPGQKALPKGGL